jgi:hypothetical protein
MLGRKSAGRRLAGEMGGHSDVLLRESFNKNHPLRLNKTARLYPVKIYSGKHFRF